MPLPQWASPLLHSPHHHPKLSLLSLFLVWKAALLTLAAVSPGDGYDSSTRLVLARSPDVLSVGVSSLKLLRWDALYYADIAARGYHFEQEWAFGWGFTRLVGRIASALLPSPVGAPDAARFAILLSHLSHMLSVLVLHQTVAELAVPADSGARLAFWAAALHVLSPAGLFLSAPYGESLFSLLSFLGFLCYVCSKNPLRSGRDGYVLASGLCFALASTVRGNGLLNASVFLYDVLSAVPEWPRILTRRDSIQKFAAQVSAGCLVAIGAAVPQWIAYDEYCREVVDAEPRPWCSRVPPSIYTWVQSHYWDVGFLRYWKLSNIPLFLLAAPMLFILVRSALFALSKPSSLSKPRQNSPLQKGQKLSYPSSFSQDCLHRLAVPQLLLALLALTSFHVQIINRISSGYPLWYISIAACLARTPDFTPFSDSEAKIILRWNLMYALVQGGLFASFLPPA